MIARRGQQLGTSLIEVLVAMTIAAITLLGLVAVQARAVSFQVDSENRRSAALLVSQMRERVSANQQGYGQALGVASGYARTLAPGGAVTIPSCANPNSCDPVTEVPALLVAQWFDEVRRQLPGGTALLEPAVAGTAQAMRLTIGWIEPNAQAVAADNACERIAAVASDPRYRCMTQILFPG